ncbi:hypothetical protein E4U30_004346 [Claviceps sp. LM220 group G6]|nr:hypothetical protein E4U30_004346 [Claviceps sp. LM220 group G6]
MYLLFRDPSSTSTEILSDQACRTVLNLAGGSTSHCSDPDTDRNKTPSQAIPEGGLYERVLETRRSGNGLPSGKDTDDVTIL